MGTMEVPLASEELQEALGHTRGGDRYFPPSSLLLHGPCSQQPSDRSTGRLLGLCSSCLAHGWRGIRCALKQRLNSLNFSFPLILC